MSASLPEAACHLPRCLPPGVTCGHFSNLSTMLFWIFVFLLTRQSGLTQGHPDLLVRTSEMSCDCTINSCRTLFDIIWGCLITIFACTWVALHQNIPDPELGHFALLMRKLCIMLVMIIAPELVVGFAIRQLISAQWISKEFNVSKTHGFFCTMGGFVSEEGHPISTEKQLPAYISAIRAIKEADIEDKSKGDALSKGVAIAQGLWFVTQCLARVSQHLPLTGLEVATLAFAVLSVVIYLLWLHKPLDVQQPIVVARSEVEIDPLQEEDMNKLNDDHPLLQRLGNVLFGIYQEYSPVSSTSVPSFHSIEKDTKKTHTLMSITGVFGVGSIFGSIHCAAWNALFPSMAEMWIWRTSFVFIAAYPVLTYLAGVGATQAPDNNIANALFESFMMVGSVVYILCRLFLIILSFTTLRALPPRTFVDVNWSNYIPHL
ncbi:hypothetical protein B0H16DRAFT_822452 [Mycena metata]|uniref:Uncharacterized protein n=1 Tax=Mycena metata TaxID=1033252 RepID=A0AAD7IVY8_9AGAR|nr:hypothetical protein B0H16DRAFT_822452 [Mycena metata]